MRSGKSVSRFWGRESAQPLRSSLKQKLHLTIVFFSPRKHRALVSFVPQQPQDPPAVKGLSLATKVRRTMSSRVHEAVKAIALCHNVTPVYESNGVTDQAEAERHYEDSCRVYQASSPDEVRPGPSDWRCDLAGC